MIRTNRRSKADQQRKRRNAQKDKTNEEKISKVVEAKEKELREVKALAAKV